MGGILALGALVIRWQLEEPQRPTIIWFMDSTKNVLAQVTAHYLAIYISYYISAEATASVSPCSWYLVVFLTDVTVGVSMALILLYFVQSLLSQFHYSTLATTGDYGQSIDRITGYVVDDNNTSIIIIYFNYHCLSPRLITCLIHLPFLAILPIISNHYICNICHKY